MSAAPELLACPFLSPRTDHVLVVAVMDQLASDPGYQVLCYGCGARGPASKDADGAAYAWNRRASFLPALRRVRDAVEGAWQKHLWKGGARVINTSFDDDKLLELTGAATSPDTGSRPRQPAINATAAPASSPPREDDVCVWCGKQYSEHYVRRPAGARVPRMPCTGLREFFARAESDPAPKTGLWADHQTCKSCGRLQVVEFHVPDDLWARVVPAAFLNKALCMSCFDGFAVGAREKWLNRIDGLWLVGREDARTIFEKARIPLAPPVPRS